ncbi:MAG: glycosyltransferase family 2 protein [Gammaproteobacteria bacterium]|nr:glycosyltransferase family 2 protein [Gammaproteobacteria bacterium]
MEILKISVIVTTYNWPEALNRVLAVLAYQDYPDFEVIVADDGSTDDTKILIEQHQRQQHYSLHHVWQPDDGFRAAAIRNRAIEQASGDYILFLDGDCIPRPHFLSRHAQLAEQGWFVTGNRILLSETATIETLTGQLPVQLYQPHQWLWMRLTGRVNRLLPLLKLPGKKWRYRNHNKWKKAITCNLAAWKNDLLDINGFNEEFQGWGLEDSDLVIRLINSDIQRKEGRFSTTVIHLWHIEAERKDLEKNQSKLQYSINNKTTLTTNGIQQNQGIS